MNTKNILLGLGGVVLAVIISLSLAPKSVTSPLGGTYNSVMVDFGEGISVDGTTVINSSGELVPTADIVLGGATPSLTIGDAGEEDAQINFDGNAQDFSIGLDDSADDLVIAKGTALGTTNLLEFTDTGLATFTGSTDGSITAYGAGTTASDAYLYLIGDAGADTSDRWRLFNDSSAAGLLFQSDPSVAGTYATAATLTSAGALTVTTSLTATTTGSFGGGFGSTGVSISSAGVLEADGLITAAVGLTATTGNLTATAGDLVLTAGRTVVGTDTQTCSTGLVVDLSVKTKGIINTTGETNTACAVSFTNGTAGEIVFFRHNYNGTGVVSFADVTGFDASWVPVAAYCSGIDANKTAANGDSFYLVGVMTSATEIMITGCQYFDAA